MKPFVVRYGAFAIPGAQWGGDGIIDFLIFKLRGKNSNRDNEAALTPAPPPLYLKRETADIQAVFEKGAKNALLVDIS